MVGRPEQRFQVVEKLTSGLLADASSANPVHNCPRERPRVRFRYRKALNGIAEDVIRKGGRRLAGCRARAGDGPRQGDAKEDGYECDRRCEPDQPALTYSREFHGTLLGSSCVARTECRTECRTDDGGAVVGARSNSGRPHSGSTVLPTLHRPPVALRYWSIGMVGSGGANLSTAV